MFAWLLRRSKAPLCFGGFTVPEWHALYRYHRLPADPAKAVATALGEALSGPRPQGDSDLDSETFLSVLLSTDRREEVRALAAMLIGVRQLAGCEGVLIAALEDYSETVRRISALALLDVATIRGLSAVVAGSRHGHAVRTEAAHRLGKRGAEAAAAIPGLLALLHYGDINWRSHMAAAYALAAIGAPALPYLFHALTCGDGYPSLYAAIALDSIGPPPEYQQLVQEMLAPLSESKGAAASAVAAPDSVRDSNSKDI